MSVVPRPALAVFEIFCTVTVSHEHEPEWHNYIVPADEIEEIQYVGARGVLETDCTADVALFYVAAGGEWADGFDSNEWGPGSHSGYHRLETGRVNSEVNSVTNEACFVAFGGSEAQRGADAWADEDQHYSCFAGN